MKSKFVAFLFLISVFGTERVSAQPITVATWGFYMPVFSYEGATFTNAYRVQIDMRLPLLNYPNWSLMVKPTGPIRNLLGRTIDPSKIKIRLNEINGNGPSIQEIGATRAPIPLSFSNVALIRKSKAPLNTGLFEFYKSFQIGFDVIIEGGAYLEDLKSFLSYKLNLEFSLLNGNDQVMHSHQPQTVDIDLFIVGSPPSGPTYSIQVLSGATAGVLEFTKPQDFATGVQAIYPGSLSVISSTPYQLQVRTLTPDFISNSLSIPVNTVGLQLKSASTTKQGTVTLSNSTQTIISNETSTGSQARLYDIRYFTQPNDNRLLKAVPENYQTTLMYTITPQ